MYIPVAQIEWQGERAKGVTPDFILPVIPEPEYEHGRKGLLSSALWLNHTDAAWPGIIWVDPDVAADPGDLEAMLTAAAELPQDVHTGLVKLWPASTGLRTWIWSHRGGTLGNPVATQDPAVPIAYVSTCFLYVPARLMKRVAADMASWPWFGFDVRLSEAALRAGVPMHAVAACQPKHLHF